MIKDSSSLKRPLPFSDIKKTIIFCFFLTFLFAVFFIISLVKFLVHSENGVTTIIPGNNLHLTSLSYFISISILIFGTVLFVLYKFVSKPMIKNILEKSNEQKQQIQQSTSILENTSDLIWAIDTDYKLLAFNSSFVNMMMEETGSAPKIGESILEKSYSKLSISDREKLYEKALAGESFETDFKYLKDGQTYYNELSFHPIYDRNKSITGCSVFKKDVTRRVEMYLELQKNEEYLKEAQEIANVGHWNWDMVKDEIQWSDQLYKLFGIDSETFEANYEGLMDIIHPDDQEVFGISIESCLTENIPHDIVHRIVMPNGSIRHVHQKGKAYHIDQDTPVRMAGTIQDVTQLEEARLQITRQYNELQNFVYIISHNVRSPISTLQSLVDIIEPGNEALNAEIIPRIGSTVDTLDRTIKDLNHSLSLKNIKESAFEEVNLRKVFEDIEHLLALDISSSEACIEYDLARAPTAMGIKSYYTNILFNLIVNSIRYKAENRPLHIRVTSQPTPVGGFEISISDNGMGMNLSPERRKRIFDMYGKLSGDTIGSGMGLYLAKTQVEVMNGSIDVESEPNQGTTFKIVFENL